ncbi:MAG: hypothetical protein LBJ48_08015 [Coriobacteriales bacterium]|jgi:hypothetical protein|nr:hypothetical protein [Coriobacteriales bacterium]
MKPGERDLSTLRHIISYCDEISDALVNHGLTAHHYGAFDADFLWETATEDIPPLKAFCLQQIAERQ